MVCPAAAAKHAQQQIADDRWRQDERKREDDVEHALHETRRLGDVVGGKNAEKEDDDGTDACDAQGIPQRVQIHSDSEGVSKKLSTCPDGGPFHAAPRHFSLKYDRIPAKKCLAQRENSSPRVASPVFRYTLDFSGSARRTRRF